tara:strand:+ start:306501 stop:307580 length:1080 start_codon:yes stop_codon:yes gene_type:complete
VKNISRALTNHGFAVVRFDFTGLGKSEGEFADSHFSANVSDLLAVNTYLQENYKAPSLLVGHSLGGAAVITAASKLENIKAVATIGAPATVNHVTKLFSHGLDDIQEKGDVTVNIGGRPFKINQEFVDDFSKTNLPEITKNLRKPLLIMHAPFDAIVGVENAEKLYQNARHPKSFISLDGADHLLSNSRDSMYVGNMIWNWVERFFDSQENTMLDTEGEQLVAHLNLREDNFTTSIQTKKHAFIADEPDSVGGDDFGPSPYDYLSAGLAACTVMTLKLYAERKKWDLQEVYAYITYSKKHSDDLMLNMDKPKRMDHLKKRLKFVGNLNEDQKNRLQEIASKCPVHKTLQTEVIIETERV